MINKSINAYLDVRNVALMIWKLALAFVIVTGLDQIALKVSACYKAVFYSLSPHPTTTKKKTQCSTFDGICLSRNRHRKQTKRDGKKCLGLKSDLNALEK